MQNHVKLFFALEGIDGSGKTNIRKYLFRKLRSMGVEVLAITPFSWLQPDATEVIVNAKFFSVDYPPEQIVQAYVKDKQCLSHQIIQPHLNYRYVISDRYIASDIVYHNVLWNIKPEYTYASYLHSSVLFPDYNIFINTPPEIAFQRLITRGTGGRHRWDTLPMQKRLYELFVDVFSNKFSWPGQTIVIDNSKSLEETYASVDREIIARLVEKLPRQES